MDVQDPVRTESRHDFAGAVRLPGQFEMALQRVCRIISGADQANVGLVDQVRRTQVPLPDLAITGLIDLVGSRFAQLVGDAKISLQFEVNPVVQGATYQAGDGMGKSAEFFQC